MIRLPLPPSANRMWRCVGGVVKLSREGRQFKADAASWLVTQKVECIEEGDVRVEMHVYFPDRRGDLDNRVKPTLDVIQGISYRNDSQITLLVVNRALDKDEPRVEVYVSVDDA